MSNLNQKSLFSTPEPPQGSPAETEVTSVPQSLHLAPGTELLMIRASAGTGKTFQLSNRFITLLRDSAADRILAATFTRKAAGEIIDRILLRLAKAVVDKSAYQDLKTFSGTPALTTRECQKLLKEITTNLHRLRIGTLDSFFARLATSFSLELKLPTTWKLIDEHESARLKDQAIDQVLREGDLQDLKTLVHQLAKGSTQRSIHTLISDHINNFYEMFKGSPAAAWKPFGKITPPSDAEFNALVMQLAEVPISDSRMSKARGDDLLRIDNEEWESLYETGLLPKVLGDGKYYKKDIPDQLKAVYLTLEKSIRLKCLFPWALQTEATYQLLVKYNAVLQQLKQETGGLEFDDVTRCLSESFRNIATKNLSHRLDGSIEHVLLDEFQDTSLAQWNVVRPFAEETTTHPGKSFFCVGDAKQAIYGWRGGEASIFDALGSQLPGLIERPLNKSFRSSQVVIDAVNSIFANMGAHNGFDDEFTTIQAWSRSFPRHETARVELPGHVRLSTSPLPEDTDLTGKDVGALDAELYRSVAQRVADQLARHPNGTIGILARRNETVGEMIYELNRLEIDASEEGGNPLTDSAAVQIILSLFRLADHPGNTIARYHIAKSPIGPLVGLTNHLDDVAAHLFAQTFRAQLVEQGYGELVDQLAHQLAGHCNQRELRRLVQLVALADEFSEMAVTLRPGEFAAFVEKQRVQEPTDSPVRVMTVHQSKGLQFDTVYVVEFDQLLLRTPSAVTFRPEPTSDPEAIALYRSRKLHEFAPARVRAAFEQTTQRNVTEALCLMYVALTRAIHSLQIVIRPRIAKSKEQGLPKTPAGLVRAALVPQASLEPGTTLYETGDPNWDQKVATHPSDDAVSSSDVPISIQFRDDQPGRRLKRAAPSRKESPATVQLGSLLPIDGSQGRERGTLYHAWLEHINWLEEGIPDDDLLLVISERLSLQNLDVQNHLTEFRTMLKRPELSRLLSKTSYESLNELPFSTKLKQTIADHDCEIVVENERRFAVRDGDSLLTGSVDRLVTISSNGKILAADIIDYKTDQLPNNIVKINERVDHYRSQLQAYRRAVSKFQGIDNDQISARLVLLGLGKVIEVSD